MIVPIWVFLALIKKRNQTKAENVEKLGQNKVSSGDHLQKLANATGENFSCLKDLDLLHEIKI